MVVRNVLRAISIFSLTGASVACEKEKIEWEGPPPNSSGAPQAKSADRLPPGQLMEGTEVAFGFAVPRGMSLIRPTRRSARIVGAVDFDELTDYVKDRIAVRHAEMLDGKLVFPNARIRAEGQEDKIYELSLTKTSTGCTLRIRDETKLPATHGLSEPERWKEVGMKPNGNLIDPKGME